MAKLKGLYILNPDAAAKIYGQAERADIARRVDIYTADQTREQVAADPSILNDAEVIFSGWGAPVLSEDFLRHAPNLRVFFYGAGGTGYILTPAVWERGIQITSAIAANAVPVAEFTLASILSGLKQTWRLSRQVRELKGFPESEQLAGAYGSVVGLISLGTIARRLLMLLSHFDLKVLVCDPFLTADEADELSVERVSLNEIFARADVVSLHTPLLAETQGMIGSAQFSLMKPGATFINTARGAVVRESELIESAIARPDLQFVLDVLVKEPPDADSLLYTLPNIALTPHTAGSVGGECRRMGRYMIEELDRYLAGKPLRWPVTAQNSINSSHRPVPPALPAVEIVEKT
jgi:phosphoglycerate dehydrogenase-like enzyme